MADAVGNVNLAPGASVKPTTTNKELLASSAEGTYVQQGVTLRVGQGVLAVGTPLVQFDDGTYGKIGATDRQVSATSNTTVAGNIITTPAAHKLQVGDEVKFGTTNGGLTAGTLYYVQSVPSSTTFTVSTTNGGAAVTITAAAATGTVTQIASDAEVEGFLRDQVDTGVTGDLAKFGNIVLRGVLTYSLIKAANGAADLDANTLAVLGARRDANRDLLIF